MHIIAGSLKGRTFASPHGHRTHPTSDKIRGALFNALGDISGLSVLDAFAGSGAFGLEAASRGAGPITMLERDVKAQRAIAENITALGLDDRIKLTRAGAGAWLQTTNTTFDLVLLDPPFDDLQPKLLVKLAERVKPGGLVTVSFPPRQTFALTGGFEPLATHEYGDANLAFYRRIS